MRKFKFRGLTINGEWVIGLLSISQGVGSQPEKGHYISNSSGMPWAYRVQPKTVGRYTDLEDKNDKEIYENDIIKLGSNVFVVQWSDSRAGWMAFSETEMGTG